MIKHKLLVPFGIAIFAVAGLLLNSGGFAPASQANKLSAGPLLLGHLELIAKDKDGNIKAYRQTDNIVNVNGKLCSLINAFGLPAGNGTQNTACGGVTTNQFRYVAIGTSTTGETATDSGVNAIVGSRTNNGTFNINNATATSPYYIITTTFHPTANTIAEASIHDAASGGHVFAHKTFTGIVLGASDTLTVTWRVTLS